MADEYIRREDAIDVLPQQISIQNPHMKGYVRGYNGCKFDAERAIKSLEPADVVPVRHGRWVNGSCDKCGKHAPYWLMSSTYYEGDFCPNCGAKMDGEE